MGFIEIGQNFGTYGNYQYSFLIIITLIWILLVLFSFRKHGWEKTLRYFFPMMIAALFIEAAGVASGRFYYPGYLLYFSVLGGRVPLIILLGWSSNLYLFLNLGKPIAARLYQKNNYVQYILIATISGLFGICLDLLEDPLAHYNSWWIWTEQTTGITILQVPFSNYIDWFIILFFMALITTLIDRTRFDEHRKVILSFTSLPFVFLAIYGIHLLVTLFLEFVGVL